MHHNHNHHNHHNHQIDSTSTTNNLLIPGLYSQQDKPSSSTLMDDLNSLSLTDGTPPSLDSLLSIAADNQAQQNAHHKHHRQQQQAASGGQRYNHHHNYYQQSGAANVHYRKVRPEPINERTLVGSVVGFIHDVVSGGDAANDGIKRPSQLAATNINTGSSAMANEVKEQIEWLHFENANLLDSFENTPLANSNILLLLGYKTGFSVWSIDVSFSLFFSLSFDL